MLKTHLSQTNPGQSPRKGKGTGVFVSRCVLTSSKGLVSLLWDSTHVKVSP